MQNMSHAVMAQRNEAQNSLDNFPTPPWATRALLEHVIKQKYINELNCLEPACGAGHMALVLKEYFNAVTASDIYNYGYGDITDFMHSLYCTGTFDWIITNPPFRLAEEFILKSLPIAKKGVAVLVRTTFLESIGRYQRLFSQTPPTKIAQFVERVPMVKGRLDKKASTATGYAWLVWEKEADYNSKLVWIPPCRKMLEKDLDYEENIKSTYLDEHIQDLREQKELLHSATEQIELSLQEI